MPGMPYHLEKGGWLSVLEDYLNADVDRRVAVLAMLRDPTVAVSDTGFLQSPSLDKDPDYETVPKRVGHLRSDWFGWTDRGPDGVPTATPEPFLVQVRQRLAAGGLTPEELAIELPDDECDHLAVLAALQEVAATVTSLRNWPVTGFWVQYFGQVETIVRETLVRTIEVSLGLDHGDEVPAAGPPRALPIELFWKCPQRWFEGWITWRWDQAHGTGQVTTLFATPGSGKPVLQDPLGGFRAVEASSSAAPAGGGSVPVGPPPSAPAMADQAPKGMWVVTHRHHLELPDLPDHFPSASGAWAIPEFGPTYVGLCDVVCVQPHEADGGTAPYGREYVEPPGGVTAAAGGGDR